MFKKFLEWLNPNKVTVVVGKTGKGKYRKVYTNGSNNTVVIDSTTDDNVNVVINGKKIK